MYPKRIRRTEEVGGKRDVSPKESKGITYSGLSNRSPDGGRVYRECVVNLYPKEELCETKVGSLLTVLYN